MVCHLCQAAGNLSEAAYGRRFMGEGPTYRERLKGQVSCGACRELLEAGSLTSNIMNQRGRVAETQQRWINPAAGAGPRNFRITFLEKGGPRNCPVEGCPSRVATRMTMQVHFLHQNILDTVVIIEEGNPPHPRCARYNMLVPRRALNSRHAATAQYDRGAERNRRQLEEVETREISEQAFEAYGEPIHIFPGFRYLGRVLTMGDYDWISVVGNIGKVQKSWGRLYQVLGREGVYLKVSGNFYKVVA